MRGRGISSTKCELDLEDQSNHGFTFNKQQQSESFWGSSVPETVKSAFRTHRCEVSLLIFCLFSYFVLSSFSLSLGALMLSFLCPQQKKKNKNPKKRFFNLTKV